MLKKIKLNFSTIILDAVLLGVVVFVGWFLIGFYLKGEYLYTGYQDWIYHAFRAQSLERYEGMPSWDHIWSNGINHWRSYQYMQHWLVHFVSVIFHLSVTKAMLALSVGIFIFLRVAIYLVLRFFGVRPIVAFLSALISYSYIQQWISLGDFSIFIALLVVPFYVYLWANIYSKYQLKKYMDIKTRRYAEFALALMSGGLWIFHPVVANALGGLFFFSIGFRAIKIQFRYFLQLLLVYIVGTLPFILPYLSSGYHFSNPMFITADFLRDTVSVYFGLSLFFIFIFGLAWLAIIFMSKNIPHWSKVIMAYSSFYVLIIYLAQNEYIPTFINQFQISRVVPALALLLVFAFGGILNGMLKNMKKVSIGVATIILIFSAVSISESIKIATIFTSQPIQYLDDPVATYFKDRDIPKGSIYVKDVSSASFFGEQGLRFVTSLNEHLLPHPLSIRFSQFMRSEIAYTGVPPSQIRNINNYATVLGIEYLFLPQTSPLIKSLTGGSSDGSFAQFEAGSAVQSVAGTFVPLRNKNQIENAYLVDKNDLRMRWDNGISTPTMQVNSYQDWDEGISYLANEILAGRANPVPLEFIGTNKLQVDLSDKNENDLKDKQMLITQSYDRYWSMEGEKSLIKPSYTNFIIVEQPEGGYNKVLTLENNWPSWHWPLEFFGITLTSSLFLLAVATPKFLRDERKLE